MQFEALYIAMFPTFDFVNENNDSNLNYAKNELASMRISTLKNNCKSNLIA